MELEEAPAGQRDFFDSWRDCVSSLHHPGAMGKLAAPQVFREAFRKAQESVFLREKKRQRVNFDWFLEEKPSPASGGSLRRLPAVPVPGSQTPPIWAHWSGESIARMLAAAAPVASPGMLRCVARAALD